MNRFHRSVLLAISSALAAAGACAADGAAPPGHTIAYVITNASWALQATPEMSECPHGLNDGVREQFKLLFPDVAGGKRTLVDTQLRRQVESYHPTAAPDALPFLEGEGPVAPGLDLDGVEGPEDFTSPEGVRGIDNQLDRVLGCIANYRAPDGPIRFFEDEMVLRENYNRIIVQLTGVDSLVDDPAVDVMIFRGRDKVLVDAGGLKALAGRHAAHRYALGQPLHPAHARAHRERRALDRAGRPAVSRGMRSTCRPTITCGARGSASR